jgi:hypothetical protein
MKSINEIKQKIEELRNEYRLIDREFPAEGDPDGEPDILMNMLLSNIAEQIKILKWVLE